MNIRKILSLIVVAVLTATSVHAQSFPSNMSMLTSKQALKVWALQQVSSGQVSVYASSQLWAYNPPNFSVQSGLTAKQVAQVVDQKTSQLYISVADPSDYVGVSTELYNSAGDLLFDGGGGAQPVFQGLGRYSLPTISMNFYLAYYIPIPIGNTVKNAELYVENPQGGWTQAIASTTQGDTSEMYIQNGKLYIQSDLAGTGILVLTDRYGNQQVYDIRDSGGMQILPPQFRTTTASAFEGIVSLTNPTMLSDEIQSYGGIGENATFEVTNTSSSFYYVPVNIGTTEGAVPRGYWVLFPGQQNWSYWNAYSGSIYIPAGHSYIIPDFDPAQFREYDPLIDGNGKG